MLPRICLPQLHTVDLGHVAITGSKILKSVHEETNVYYYSTVPANKHWTGLSCSIVEIPTMFQSHRFNFKLFFKKSTNVVYIYTRGIVQSCIKVHLTNFGKCHTKYETHKIMSTLPPEQRRFKTV